MKDTQNDNQNNKPSKRTIIIIIAVIVLLIIILKQPVQDYFEEAIEDIIDRTCTFGPLD